MFFRSLCMYNLIITGGCMKCFKDLKGEERRIDIRKSCFFAEVDYAVGSKVFTDSIKNICNGGVFIETNADLEVGDGLKMLFSDFSNIDLITINGDVIRLIPGGVAVRFDQGSTLQQKEMRNYILKI